MTTVTIRDDDGIKVRAGDTIQFSYGIPPAVARGTVVRRGRRLFVHLDAPHKPTECNLRSLRRYVGCWYRVEGKP